MPVLSLACHLPHNAPHIPWRYNYEQTTKQTKAINNSYIYINISCKCDTNRAGHLTLDAYASRPVACSVSDSECMTSLRSPSYWPSVIMLSLAMVSPTCTYPNMITFSVDYMLTHWGQDKMAAISQTTFSSVFSWMKSFEFKKKNLLKFVPKGPISNIPALVLIMAWRRTGDKPLSESMLA